MVYRAFIGDRSSSAASYNFRDFGAKFDGSSDDTLAIQAGINYVSGLDYGGTIMAPSGLAVLSNTISITKSNVNIIGVGGLGSTHHDVGSQSSGAITTFLWNGSAAGTMVSIAPVTNTSTGQNLSNCGFQGIRLNCNNLAGTGLAFKSCLASKIDVYVAEATTVGILIDTVSLGEFNDPQNNEFNLRVRNDTATGTGIILDGTGVAGAWLGNVSFNLFRMINIVMTGSADGLVLNYADHNVFDYVKIGRAAGGTGNGIVFNGSNVSAGRVAYLNKMDLVTSNAPIVARGTTTFTYPSYSNIINCLDKGNGSPDPTIETGSSMTVRIDSGKFYNLIISPAGAGSGSFVAGGAGNTANGADAFVGAGSGNAAGGFGTSVFGQNISASGTDSMYSGQNHSGTGSSNFVTGIAATDKGRRGQIVMSGSSFSANGDSQMAITLLRNVATSASAVRLTNDASTAGATNTVNLTNLSCYMIKVSVMAYDTTTTTKYLMWDGYSGVVIRGANAAATTIAMNTKPTPLTGGTVTGADISVTADTGNGAINVSFTPPTANTDTWHVVARVDTIEVG